MPAAGRRGASADGQSYLAESDTDAEEARMLRPLQAGAVTYRIALLSDERIRVNAAGEAAAEATGEIRGEAQPVQDRAKRIGWARLLRRVFDIDLRRCPGRAPWPPSGPSPGSRPGWRAVNARTPIGDTARYVWTTDLASCGRRASGLLIAPAMMSTFERFLSPRSRRSCGPRVADVQNRFPEIPIRAHFGFQSAVRGRPSMKSVKSVLARKSGTLVQIRSGDMLVEALLQMRDNRVRSVLVIDDDVLVGIVTHG
jgi:hypothetical protein